MSNDKDQFTAYREARQKTNELRNLAIVYRLVDRTRVADEIERVVDAIDLDKANRSSRTL